jgi:hypothetical protein
MESDATGTYFPELTRALYDLEDLLLRFLHLLATLEDLTDEFGVADGSAVSVDALRSQVSGAWGAVADALTSGDAVAARSVRRLTLALLTDERLGAILDSCRAVVPPDDPRIAAYVDAVARLGHDAMRVFEDIEAALTGDWVGGGALS